MEKARKRGMSGKIVRVGLLGAGKIGRELIRRTLDNPRYGYVAVGDKSGVVVSDGVFTGEEMRGIIGLKENGGRLKDYGKGHSYYESMLDALESREADVLVDVTDAQTYPILAKALEHAHVVTSNKAPIADCSYDRFRKLVLKAREEKRILDIGTTVGAGMRIPNLIRALGVEGIERISGCLSGTMNHLSQRINEGITLSAAVKEAMDPPRCYTEPDPRIDLGGGDFARKLVIIGRMCGRNVERKSVKIEEIVPEELKTLGINDFLKALPTLDSTIRARMDSANGGGKTMWYLGTADLLNNEYRVGFEEVSMEDPITRSRESDNALKINRSLWRRPIMITGPGAGVPETVSGLISGLSSISDLLD